VRRLTNMRNLNILLWSFFWLSNFKLGPSSFICGTWKAEGEGEERKKSSIESLYERGSVTTPIICPRSLGLRTPEFAGKYYF